MQSTADSKSLRRRPPKKLFYGKWEASLCLHTIFAKAGSPNNFASNVQKALYIQWMLNHGERLGTVLKGSGKMQFLQLQDIVIKHETVTKWGQPPPWSWIVEVQLSTWKGDIDLTVQTNIQTAVCHATRLRQNLQFEVATMLIPFLIFRKALAAVTSEGKKIAICSVSEFLVSNEMLFVSVSEEPLFVTMEWGFGGLMLDSNPVLPLTTSSSAVALGKLYAEVSLAIPGAYTFQYKKGNMIKIIHGKTTQGEALCYRSSSRERG